MWTQKITVKQLVLVFSTHRLVKTAYKYYRLHKKSNSLQSPFIKELIRIISKVKFWLVKLRLEFN